MFETKEKWNSVHRFIERVLDLKKKDLNPRQLAEVVLPRGFLRVTPKFKLRGGFLAGGLLFFYPS